MRAESISRKVRALHYYTVEAAGQQVGLKRTKSYQAVEAGVIPVERDGKLMLVPRKSWDRRVKRLLSGQPP